jgi:FkbM family methyltransferase
MISIIIFLTKLKMRRLKIIYFWLFINKNNVTFIELLQFIIKPRINTIANQFISSIKQNENDVEVNFNNIPNSLFWPKNFSLDRLDQIVCESFDVNDWHYYQKKHTEVSLGDIILDIGTAEGLFPLAVIDKCEHIYMVEPSKNFYTCLQKTFSTYSNKTTFFNIAVGSEDGEISFDENALEGMISKDNGNNTITINKIDTILDGKKITYLKADIEGFEQEMLKGASETIKRNKPKIAITTYHSENNPQEIVDLIKSYVPEYNYYYKGVYEVTPKPVMIHFWI